MLTDNIKTFLTHKKIIWVIVVSSILMGLLEQYLVGSPTDYMDSDALENTNTWFFVTTLLNYLIFIWALIALFSKLSSLRRVSKLAVFLSFVKACICILGWVFLSIFLIQRIILAFGVIEPTQSSLFMLSSFELITTMLLIFFVVCFYYSIFVVVFLGSISRTIFRQIPLKKWSTLAAWYLPFTSIFAVFKLPLVWLVLSITLALKMLGFLLLSAGVPYIQLLTEPLAMLSLLFSFYIGYEAYARKQISNIISDYMARQY